MFRFLLLLLGLLPLRLCRLLGDDQEQHGIAWLRAQTRFQIQKLCKVCRGSLKRKRTGQEETQGPNKFT
jgi:hypothetical protein